MNKSRGIVVHKDSVFACFLDQEGENFSDSVSVS